MFAVPLTPTITGIGLTPASTWTETPIARDEDREKLSDFVFVYEISRVIVLDRGEIQISYQ